VKIPKKRTKVEHIKLYQRKNGRKAIYVFTIKFVETFLREVWHVLAPIQWKSNAALHKEGKWYKEPHEKPCKMNENGRRRRGRKSDFRSFLHCDGVAGQSRK